MFRLLRLAPLALLLAGSLLAEPAAPPPAPVADDATSEDDKPAPAKRSPGEEKYWQALLLTESTDPADTAKARQLLQAAADLEFTHAQNYLGDCLMSGDLGFPKDKRKAANLYRLAAERGNSYAQVNLGRCYYLGNGIRKNRDKAAEWLELAVSDKADYSHPPAPEEFVAAREKFKKPDADRAGQLEGDSEGDNRANAHLILGVIATDNKKPELAHKHFTAAATAGVDGRSGIKSAAVQAALNYAFGRGTPRDMTKANEMLAISRKLTVRAGMRNIHYYSTRKAVLDFDAETAESEVETESEKFQTGFQFDIAQSFTDKKSKDYNPAEAVKWYELAADSGSAWAMLSLAFLYSGNELGQPDPTKAFAWFEKAGGGDKPKHYLGTANLAICLQNGIGTAKDTERAKALFEKHKQQDFVCYLGTLGHCPAKTLTFEENLKLIETWAKNKKDAHAQYLYAESHRDGWTGKYDLRAAIKWYKKAADANHGGAWYALGLLHGSAFQLFDEYPSEGQKNMFNCMKKGSDAGYPAAIAEYAYILSQYKDGTDDVIEKLYLRCLEVDPENGQAHNNLAVIYDRRARDPRNGEAAKDKAAMFKHYEAAIKSGFALAARNLAKLHEDGVLVPVDRRKAYSYYEKAAELGMTTMHFDIAQMLEKGLGVPVSFTEAAYHYRLAALENHEPSLRQLINLYLSGKTGEVDMERALFWLFRLARYDTDALKTAADLMLQKKDYGPAIELLRELEEKGSPTQVSFACERLSRCYEKGLGVKANPSKAKKYYQRALAGNDPEAVAWRGMELMKAGKHAEGVAAFKQASEHSSAACFYLGQLYFFGTHVEKDQARALKLMRRAAANNNPNALYFLAGTTLNKVPGAPTLEEAIRLASQAEAAGHEKAKALREKLEKHREKTGDPATNEEATRARSS